MKNEFKLEKVNIRLVPDAPIYSKTPITTPEDAIYMVADILKDMDRECVCVINMSQRGHPINVNIVSIGAINYCVVHPADIFKSAILSNATGFILVHNHPSGDVHPSREDILVTDRLKQAGEIMGITLTDHVIVNPEVSKYFSIKANETRLYTERETKRDVNEEALINNFRR